MLKGAGFFFFMLMLVYDDFKILACKLKNSANDILKYMFVFIYLIIYLFICSNSDISCKLEDNLQNAQILFSGNKYKNIINLSSTDYAHSVLSV